MADVNIDLDTKDSKQLFNQGVKAYVLKDYKNAVDALGKATEIMVAELGDDLHDSLGETYLYYGKALLEVYRQESDPIGNLPKTIDTSTTEEQEPEEDEEAENQENEEMDESKDNDGEEAANGDDTKENADGEEEMEEEEEDCLKVDEANKSGAGAANESFLELDPKEPEEDEEPSDLQVAWEVLELAKKIFTKRTGDEAKKSLADTLSALGEISLESENFLAAINDFKTAVEIQVLIYPKGSRKLAETYYNLAMSYSSHSVYREAITNFKKSIEHLEKRIWYLEDKNIEREEIQEIQKLIPEIYEKIRDLQAFTDETLKKLEELTKQPELASKILDSASSSSSTSQKATDITHLVKRKRKPEENDEESNPSKKCPQ
ncbi:protein HGV2 [Harmonia axyridis]|uniref:protein HGV2 n=1 Tax=Harmonia axyridis TaxID=115357 RepID=UPI001E27922B|nr:protein HGV2 [Harmonia axyridis]XP_045476789.1 protein HGV2 [Harmonia axyridis]